MDNRTTAWIFTGITGALLVAAISLPLMIFPYAETTKDPDAIEFVVWFFAVGILFLGLSLIPVTIGIWLFYRNESSETETLKIVRKTSR